jgi:L-asparaginase II
VREGRVPEQVHNNSSGKHAGFQMLEQRIGGGPEYVEPDHPVQRAVLHAYEDVTGVESPGHGIDGCSAPNFATTLLGLATAMARCASAHDRAGARDRAMARLVAAMRLHPELVAGEGRACTELMRAMDGVALKTGAEGVFTAILPDRRLGVALKIADGATRASEAAMTAILVLLGALDPAHPAALKRTHAPVLTRFGVPVGEVRAAVS